MGGIVVELIKDIIKIEISSNIIFIDEEIFLFKIDF